MLAHNFNYKSGGDIEKYVNKSYYNSELNGENQIE